MDKYELTVVIPVFNAQNFIARTINSVIANEDVSIEIICVLDNCNDKTKKILEQIKKTTQFNGELKIIERNFGSVALSRNAGIEIANSDFIAFVDHDDLIEPYMYALLLSEAQRTDADVVRCGFSIKRRNEWERNIPLFGRSFYAFFGIFIWNAIYKVDFLQGEKILFSPGFGEDYQFNLEVGFRAHKISWVKKPLYHWIDHPNNLHKKRKETDFIERVESIGKKFAKEVLNDPNTLTSFSMFIVDSFWFHANKENFRELYNLYLGSQIVYDYLSAMPSNYRGCKDLINRKKYLVTKSDLITLSSIRKLLRHYKSKNHTSFIFWLYQNFLRVISRIRRRLAKRKSFLILKNVRAWELGLLNSLLPNKYTLDVVKRRHNLKNGTSCIAFLVYNRDVISGGIISIFRLADETRQIIRDKPVQIFTNYQIFINEKQVYKYTWFNNQEILLGFNFLIELIKDRKIELLHIPEVLTEWFYFEINKRCIDISKLRINILNQNDELMPSGQILSNLKRECKTLTMTTAHEKYSKREDSQKWGIPLKHISTYISPHDYRIVPFNLKQNNILVSCDNYIFRDEILKFLNNSMVGYCVATIIKMQYEEYLMFVSQSKFMITLGEGLDNYFIESVFTGGIPFAIYSPDYMPVDMLGLDNIVKSYESLLDRVDRIIFLVETDESYRRNLWARNYSLLSSMYKYNEHLQKLADFYKGRYDYYEI